MVCYTDPMKTISYSEHMSDDFLKFITHFGMIYFYAISFLLRPARTWRLFRNLFITKKVETKLEQALSRLLAKHNAADSAQTS